MRSARTLAFSGLATLLRVSSLFASSATPQQLDRSYTLETFHVGSAPADLVFDGANIWISDAFNGTVAKLRASDGFQLGAFPAGDDLSSITFDGANIWVVNYDERTLTKLRASDGSLLGTFPWEDLSLISPVTAPTSGSQT
jgi:hypothetical protein